MGITKPNKLINQHVLCGTEIFPYVMDYFNATSDMSFAYIPINETTKSVLRRENPNNQNEYDSYTMVFNKKDDTNGYADLGIGFLNKDRESNNKYVKVVHINSLHRFNIDSNIFTFNENLENLYYVYYSDVEFKNTTNKKFAIIPAQTLSAFFNTLNFHTDNQTVDLITMKDTLEILGRYSIIDVDENFMDTLDEGTQINISIKQKKCYETLNADWYCSTNPKCIGKAFTRTHYGNQYTAFNLTKGKIYNFRDACALKGFCTRYNITDTKMEEISKKCRYQEDMINGETPDRYSVNLYTDTNNEEWILLKRQADSDSDIDSNFELVDKIKKILWVLYENSPRWSKRLRSKLKVFLSNIDKFCKHLKKMFVKIMHTVITTLLNEDFSPDYIFTNLRFANIFRYSSHNLSPSI